MKLQNKIMLVCFGILIFFMVSILVRCVTVHLLVKKMHMDNVLTQTVLFDNKTLQQKVSDSKEISIDWEKLYPFDESSNTSVSKNDNVTITGINKIDNKVEKVEEKITDWTTKYLIEYGKLAEINAFANKILGWNLQSYTEYNGATQLEDGHLACLYMRKDMTEKINNVTSIAKFCRSKNIDFLYVSAPSKIARDEQKYKGLDYSNDNADEFLAGLKDNNVDYIDLRDNIEAEGLNLRSLFFRTDHHWLPQTGLWATGIIAKYLAEKNIVVGDLSLLNPDQYEKKVYEKWFLGSRGKKVTLSKTEPDDISLLYPKFFTDIIYEVPQKEWNREGDFSVVYDIKHIDVKDYYNKNPYHAYLGSNWQRCVITNKQAINDKKILIIKNSFGNVVMPFLALECACIDSIDLRHFKGSVKNYIEQTKPDVVIVLYHIEALNKEFKYSSHDSEWDFR